MAILIVDENEGSKTTGKIITLMHVEKNLSLTVWFWPTGNLNVIVHNASNRVFKKLGKTFRSISEAIANYKTAEIREMIQFASDHAKAASPAQV